MNEIQPTKFSQILHEARKTARPIESLTKTHGDFPLETAYLVQAQGIELRQNEGEKIIGYKMGLTSKAKMEQMGLHTPIYGVLTDAMEIKNGGTLQLTGRIHPKAEPEIYFRTSKELQGQVSPIEALAACAEVGVALEILDSRYEGFKYFTLPDVVADNSSSALFVLGDSVKLPMELNLKELTIEINGGNQIRFSASSTAILGDPILSLCELVKLLDEQKQSLPSGSVVLAGAATQAIALEPGQTITATLSRVGQVAFHVND